MRSTHHRLVLCAAVPLLAAATLPAGAAAQAPPGPPGPPPGNGVDLPGPPGTPPPAVPPGTPAAVPAGVAGPALLSGSAVELDRKRRRFAIPLACPASGRVSVQARGIRGGTFASASYRCVRQPGDRDAAREEEDTKRLRRKHVRRHRPSAEGGRSARVSFTLVTKGAAPPAGRSGPTAGCIARRTPAGSRRRTS